MTESDPLAEKLGVDRAAALRRALAIRNQTITTDRNAWTGKGYTAAVLAEVEVAYEQADHHLPTRCIAKVCPPGTGKPESASHDAARRQYFRPEFVSKHLVEMPFEPVECSDGTVVVFQQIAGGHLKRLRTLSRVSGAGLAETCRAVRAALLEQWTGDAYRTARLTVPDLLQSELRGDLAGWVVAPEIPWIATQEDGALPNPLALIRDDDLAAAGPQTYVAGRSHGDLHADNVLVPTTLDGAVLSGEFQLVDLSAFDHAAPLSRDPATLLVSILAHRVERLDPSDREALLGHVTVPGRRSVASADLANVVDALRDPGAATFVGRGLTAVWETQLQVSMIAAALLHTTYDSVGPEGRWWCLRMAARLASTLVTAEPMGQPYPLASSVFGAAPSQRPTPPRTGPKLPIINQTEAKKRLRAAVVGSGPGIAVVHGMAGVGKSALVAEVIAELRTSEIRVIEHDAAGLIRPDAMTLVRDVEACDPSDDRSRPGDSLPARLAAAVDTLDTRLAVVIERAELLLTNDTHTVADSDLDDALEVLSSPRRHVRVVLVTREIPRSARSNTWPDNARLVHVQGLEEPYFDQFLARLDPAGQAGLTALDDATREMLRDRLQGNPTYASLAHAVVSSMDGEYSADSLAAAVAKLRPRVVPQFLANEQMRRLPEPTKLVLAALAAFGVPVDAAAVSAVVKDRHDAVYVAEILRKLAVRGLAEEADGRYRIPTADPHRLLEVPPVPRQQWQDLLFDAARELGMRRKRMTDVHDLDDLDLYFAEMDVLLRAQLYGPAYERLEPTDTLLRRWDRELMLLDRRERIRHLLDDPVDQLSNYTALGDLYTTLGRFPDARGAFTAALEIATNLDDRANKLGIEINMAAMHWEAGEIAEAERRFRGAHHAAARDGDATDRMGALEGLADCHRRWGDYSSAIPLARRALSIGQQASSDRAVNIALKLARWHAEIEDRASAELLVAAAETEAAEHADEALRTACVDGRADLLLLTTGREVEVLELAGAAVAAARRQRSPVLQLQAQTTRCMAYLRLGDINEASDAIDAADRYRRKGRSLVVLALHALVSALGRDTAEAERRFDRLRREAADRGRDPRDVGALQFLGYGLCWPALTDDGALCEAAELFHKARNQTRPAAPAVEERLSYLVRRLEEGLDRPGRLRVVLDAIAD